MKIDVLTLFPEMFAGPLDVSMVARARKAGLLDLQIRNLRDWTHDRHKTVDDRPFGGGPGMVLKPEPIFEAVESLADDKTHVILTARNAKDLEGVEDAIFDAGGSATIAPLDLTDGDSISRLAAAVTERWGKLDILVLNAALLAHSRRCLLSTAQS